MIKSSFKFFVRSILRNTQNALINIGGLSVGIAAFILISLYVKSELEYDQFHQDSDRIYRLLYHSQSPTNDIVWARSGPGTVPALAAMLPEIEQATRILAGKNVLDPDPLVSRDDLQFLEPDLFYADTDFFELFTFETLNGAAVDFSDPYALVITESTARKYFSDENAIGQTLEIAGQGTYTVKQVIKDVPVNSHFHFDLVANIQSHSVGQNTGWGWTRVYSYIKLRAGTDLATTDKKIQTALDKAFAQRSFSNGSYADWKAGGNSVSLKLQPLESIHLGSGYASEFEPGGDIASVRLFFAVALLVLLLACINFINLVTAQAGKRAREVGVKKSLGASRSLLIRQFMSESVLLCLLATVLAVGLTALGFPYLNKLVGYRIAVPEVNGLLGLLAMGFVLILGLLAGAYPAFVLSAFNPVRVLKSGTGGIQRKSTLRNVLTVVQFCASIGLVIATITIYQQVYFMKQTDRGFADQLLVLDRTNILGEQTEAFKEELMRTPAVSSVAASSTVPGSWIGSVSLYPLSGTVADRVIVYPIFTDFDFAKTYKFEFVQGRSFSKTIASDSIAVLVNETALKAFGLESIEGEYLKGWVGNHPIVGVVKDFNQKSVREQVQPMVIFANFFPSMQNMTIRLNGENPQAALQSVQATWKRFVPEEPLLYSFLDDNFDRLYSNDLETGNLFTLLSILALFIAALGLFGMASFITEQRGKEFAIRKVLGATSRVVFVLLGKGFGRLILLAFLITVPAVWYGLDNWLNSFAQRISVPVGAVILGGIITLAVTALAVTGQSLRTAFENPVKRLKTDG